MDRCRLAAAGRAASLSLLFVAGLPPLACAPREPPRAQSPSQPGGSALTQPPGSPARPDPPALPAPLPEPEPQAEIVLDPLAIMIPGSREKGAAIALALIACVERMPSGTMPTVQRQECIRTALDSLESEIWSGVDTTQCRPGRSSRTDPGCERFALFVGFLSSDSECAPEHQSRSPTLFGYCMTLDADSRRKQRPGYYYAAGPSRRYDTMRSMLQPSAMKAYNTLRERMAQLQSSVQVTLTQDSCQSRELCTNGPLELPCGTPGATSQGRMARRSSAVEVSNASAMPLWCAYPPQSGGLLGLLPPPPADRQQFLGFPPPVPRRDPRQRKTLVPVGRKALLQHDATLDSCAPRKSQVRCVVTEEALRSAGEQELRALIAALQLHQMKIAPARYVDVPPEVGGEFNFEGSSGVLKARPVELLFE
jgi:hypothetical protein